VGGTKLRMIGSSNPAAANVSKILNEVESFRSTRSDSTRRTHFIGSSERQIVVSPTEHNIKWRPIHPLGRIKLLNPAVDSTHRYGHSAAHKECHSLGHISMREY